MKLELLASSLNRELDRQYLTSYLINGTLAVDAGPIGLIGGPVDLGQVRHVLITHAHMDHIATLPILIEAGLEAGNGGVTIHASQAVLDSLRAHIFNDEIWPDLARLSSPSRPFLTLQPVNPFEPFELDGLKITAIPVDHVVPTQGFLISDCEASILIASDTGPTEAIWRVANATADLKAIYLEVSFPDSMTELARLAKHLTPSLFAAEVAKLTGAPRLIAVHLKPRYRRRIIEELERIGLDRLEIGVPGREYRFP